MVKALTTFKSQESATTTAPPQYTYKAATQPWKAVKKSAMPASSHQHLGTEMAPGETDPEAGQAKPAALFSVRCSRAEAG